VSDGFQPALIDSPPKLRNGFISRQPIGHIKTCLLCFDHGWAVWNASKLCRSNDVDRLA
jgi:hypothetical protein